MITQDKLDWRLVMPDECVLWFRRGHKRSRWRAHGIATEEVCRGMAKSMALLYPKRSIVVLQKYVTPIREARRGH